MSSEEGASTCTEIVEEPEEPIEEPTEEEPIEEPTEEEPIDEPSEEPIDEPAGELTGGSVTGVGSCAAVGGEGVWIGLVLLAMRRRRVRV